MKLIKLLYYRNRKILVIKLYLNYLNSRNMLYQNKHYNYTIFFIKTI